MAPTAGSSQQEVLRQLLERKSGATLDELTKAVGLSRTAVNQHLISLEADGHICKAAPRKTGGRPQHVYVLTESGANLFPKQYSWFSKMLIQTLRQQVGEEKVSQYMYDLGVQLSAGLIPRLVGMNRTERINEIVKIMNETGFVARTVAPGDSEKLPRVECKNCVYHDLSKDYPEVCRFDIGFLAGLMGAEVEHQSCMQRGGEACRFKFIPPA
jgi:DeoR family suf operon transcriptional repressor